ncbi:uncharacterized protein N7511_008296 [Penicillium nucicola]|uniref:uncharacterized protein n=1 Tax=Penicillium nucicola TaxID=1850975 RepID=UPI0025453F4C|nr:uncharacterized protein N7511_008296 [Penicillium nucicola]KAJ5754143.1 hypothetical protein N7511_008296 [Penicillium nucicola]
MERSNQLTSYCETTKYHLYTLWLLIFSDLKTIIAPSTIFGIANGWAAPKYGLQVPSTLANPENVMDFLHLIGRAMMVLSWVLVNFIPFAINNQRGERAIAEDLLNKPWRPFPSDRISHKQGTRAMFALYIFACVYSTSFSGGSRHSAVLIILGSWYNNWGGADNGPIVRNIINALGYVCFVFGAMEVFLGGSALPLHPEGVLDMSDQLGDAQRGRSVRVLAVRNVPGDKRTFQLWNWWIVIVYILPLFSEAERHERSVRHSNMFFRNPFKTKKPNDEPAPEPKVKVEKKEKRTPKRHPPFIDYYTGAPVWRSPDYNSSHYKAAQYSNTRYNPDAFGTNSALAAGVL